MINLFKACVKKIIGRGKCLLYNISHGKNVEFGTHFKYVNEHGRMSVGNNVIISSFTYIFNVRPNAYVEIGSNVRIGHHLQISCANHIHICSNVNIGPFVFLTDHNHKFENPNIPIKDQGIFVKPGAALVIGEGAWLGTKVTIVGDVHIGKHCVIGANSVVTKDIPDYSIAVGTPARVIKQYNFKAQCWERINKQ